MSRRLVNLTLDTLEDLPRPCRQCVYWELDPVAAERACASGDPGLEKEAWVSQTLLEWGSCGKLAYVDGMAAALRAAQDRIAADAAHAEQLTSDLASAQAKLKTLEATIKKATAVARTRTVSTVSTTRTSSGTTSTHHDDDGAEHDD